MLKKGNSKLYFFAVLLILTIGGCSVWQNFTAYFNTYYNAKTLFEQVEEDRENLNHPLFEFKEPKLPGSAQTPIVKVIEKCSKILQFDKESSYVDDALLMIGKSFYYQSEYAKALRKFNELAAVDETDLKLENQFWIGLTDLQLRNFDEGFNKLEEVKQMALEEEEDELVDRVYIKQIAFLNSRENYSDAVKLSKKLLETTEDEELKAETYFQLAKFYVELDQVENAAEAFAAVDLYSPSFEIEFLSKFEAAKLQKELGNVDQSLELLQDMRDEGKFNQHFDELDLEIAQIYLDKEEPGAALELYTVIDTTYKSKPSSGEAKFKRAEIWEKYYRDYDSAKFYYDQTVSSTAPNERKNEARTKSATFTTYFKLKTEQDKLYDQIIYRTDPEAFYRDSLAYADYISRDTSTAAVSDSILFNRDNLPDEPDEDEKDIAAVKSDTTKSEEKIIKPVKMDIPDDSLNTLIAKNLYELGNVFFGELQVTDSAYYYYNLVDSQYPDISFKPKFLFTYANYFSSIGEENKADSLFNYVYSNYSADPVAAEAAKRLGKTEITATTDPVELSYIGAEEIYFASNFDTAIDSFYNIYKEHPNSSLAPKALYTIGYILENDLQLLDSAAAVYDSLAKNYSNTDYARASAKKINFYKSYHKKIQDSLDFIQKQVADSLKADSLAIAVPEIIESDSLESADNILPDNLISTELQPDSSAHIREEPLKTPADKKLKEYKDLLKPNNDLPDSVKKKLR